MQNFNHIKVSSLSPQIGAEISGVDLSSPLSPEVRREIHQALLQHLVVFFRDQTLEPTDLHRAAGNFGQPVPYPFVNGIDGFPEIVEVLKLPEETSNFGGVWHLNEGHCAFVSLQRLRKQVKSGSTFQEALNLVRKSTVFTTHTPVPAGHDKFDLDQIVDKFDNLWDDLKITKEQFLQLGIDDDDEHPKPIP